MFLQDEARGAVLIVGAFPERGAALSSCVSLAERLGAAGWNVLTTSSARSRPRRLVEVALTTYRRRHAYEVAVVDVFSGLAFLWAEAACEALRAARKPFVLVLRGGNLPAFAHAWPSPVRTLLRSASAVVTPSAYLLEALRRYRSDLLLVPNAVPLDAFRFRERTAPAPRLAWVRAFHATYNPRLAVRVLAALAAEGRDATLVMAGRDKDGSLAAVRRLAEDLGVAARLETPGGIPNEDVPALHARADVFLNTTNVDNAPVSVLEAMASGLPVVSTDVGGIRHLATPGRDALLVPPRDARAMTDAVRRVLDEPGLAARLSHGARATAEAHGWGVVLPAWESLLAEAARRGAAAA